MTSNTGRMNSEIALKKYDHDLGYGPKTWAWPSADEKLFSIFDMVKEIDEWIDLCKGFDVAVQAGGAVGVWPLRLSRTFDIVHTFEAHPENYQCLIQNCVKDNVCAYHAALSDRKRKVKIYNLPHQTNNFGAGYIVDADDGVDTVLIDELGLETCDLICLDIEGAELEALKGAEQTIAEFRPLVVLEDKQMPQLSHFKREVGAPGEWLKQFGYKLAKTVHWDSVYSC